MENDNEEVKPKTVSDETIIQECFSYIQDDNLSPRRVWLTNTVAESINFVELRQWVSEDVSKLALIGVPTVAIDKITRSLDTLDGIRANTGGRKKVVKREFGDERVAQILDKSCDYISYRGGFKEVKDEAFKSLLYTGIGIRKIGFDPYANRGDGEIWAEKVEVEDFWWGKCKRKDLSDSNWFAESQVVDWQDAVNIAPDRAGEIEGLKRQLQTNWEKIKNNYSQGSVSGRDYQNMQSKPQEPPYQYKDQVRLWNFWFKKSIPYKKIASVTRTIAPNGQILAQQNLRAEPLGYELAEGEQDAGRGIEVFWVHHVLVGEQGGAIRLVSEQLEDHPYVIECAQRKKNGMPFGFIEKIVPHQKRINLAWAQKMAYNNKSIKAPIVADEDAFDLQTAVKATSFGTVLFKKQGKRIESINMSLNTNLQAVEEMNAAISDMNNVSAAGEPVLSGQAGNTKSGIQLSMQQNSAITPINKWIEAENDSEIVFYRKVVDFMVKYYTPQKFARIIGIKEFMQMVSPVIDPYGNIIEQPVQFPLDPNVTMYDVVMEEKALSDFKKQMTFNSAMALQQSVPGGMFDPEYLIKNAPLENSDEALASYKKHQQDLQIQQMAMLQQASGGGSYQPLNAITGKTAPQFTQEMIGGTSPNAPTSLGIQQ